MIPRRTLVQTGLAGAAAPFLSRAVRAQAPVEEIRLAVNAASFVLAVEKIGEQVGLWAQHGLRPSVVVMESGAAALSALIAGSAAFSVNAPSETLAARARGQDVVIVANLYAGQAASLLLGTASVQRLGVPATAPVKDRLRALDGLVVAVPSATSAPLGPIRAAAEAAGAAFRLTYMAQGAMPAALETGAIQGMIAAFPFAAAPVMRGTGVIWINGPGGDLPPDLRLSSSASVQTSAAYLQTHPQTVRKLQAAVVAISNFIQSDRAAAKRALAASYPQMGQAEIDLAFEQQWRNWTKPFLTEADVRQDLRMLIASTKAPGLDRLDPAAALAGLQ